MLVPSNTSPCHDPLHLFAKTAESQHAGIAQQLSDRALKDKIHLSVVAFVFALVVYSLLIYNAYGILASAPFIAYATVFLGVHNKRLPFVAYFSNYSYGIYLYGFPMQQVVYYLLPNYRVWWINFILSAIATVGIAAISWHLVEKPIDKNKKLIVKRILAFRDNAMSRMAAFRTNKPVADGFPLGTERLEVRTAPIDQT